MINRVLTCVGKYADIPYYFDKIYVNVYSAEELCFVLYENAFLLDRDVVDRKLVVWIERELQLATLARELYGLVNANASAAAFVGTILTYVGYHGADEIAKAESILRLNVSMNAYEKMKAKADFLVENKHYSLSLREYEKVLDVLPADEIDLRSRIFDNLGVAYMNLYLFDSAEKCFSNAYKLNNNEKAFKHYLMAKRLSLSESDYVKFVSENEEAYRLSIALEGEIEEIKYSFDETVEAAELKELFELRNSGKTSSYYEEIDKLTESLKEDYKDIVLETERNENGE